MCHNPCLEFYEELQQETNFALSGTVLHVRLFTSVSGMQLTDTFDLTAGADRYINA
jgi:hypothetical protein